MRLQLEHITRKFSGITALDNVCLDIYASEIHALCGENGAGKSTLINIISGNLQPTQGNILLNGNTVRVENPLHAQHLGIAVVHQEKSLVDSLSIAENIFAGQQPVNKWGFIDSKKLYEQTSTLLQKLRLDYLRPGTLVSTLSPAQKQMVEIAKALAKNPSILLLDEPTASITENETKLLFSIIKQLKQEGVAIVYISHRMAEIFAIADKVTVLKDGKYQGTKNIADTNIHELIRMMVGRNISLPERRRHVQDEVLLELKHLSGKGFNEITLTLRKGEIVGLAGLVGSGRTEIAKAIFGANTITKGAILINHKKAVIKKTTQAIEAGIGYLPEERKTEGIFSNMSVADNIISASLQSANSKGFFSKTKVNNIAASFTSKLRIAAGSTHQKMSTLSGGNQQKVVLSKWLLSNPDILIVDEPTHGVDIGAKFEIYQLVRQQAAEGKAILLISSELPELLLLSDTVLVIRNGSVASRMDSAEATEENIMQAACGF